MIPVLTAAEMREADRRTIEEIGVPGPVLMENAGAAVARALLERYPRARRPAILCGKGNNGGDGLVVARRLLDRQPTVLLVGGRDELKGDAALNLGIFERSGGRITELPDAGAWGRARERLAEADLLVDALLGTGLKQAPSGLVADVIEHLSATHAQGRVPVVAVDIPSGLSSDTGQLEWGAAGASLTVTFGAPKWGHVLPPACDRVGELLVAEIGIPRQVLLDTKAALFLLEPGDAARAFPPRPPGAHKGTYGHLLVIAGGPGKTGAAVLAATAALRCGTGLVTVATAAPLLPIVAAGRAEVMTEPLPVDPSGALRAEALSRALALAEARDAVVLGPGLGQEEATCAFVRGFLARCARPVIVDADGLNCLAARAGGSPLERPSGAATVLTPHPGEMARLEGTTSAAVQARRVEVARNLARRSGAAVALKGQRSVIAEPGGHAAVNPTGNPGMATGGTGDVLSGMIGALLARGLGPWEAAACSVYVHGLAGDLAARRVGQESLVAGDVLDSLPEAIRSLAEGAAS